MSKIRQEQAKKVRVTYASQCRLPGGILVYLFGKKAYFSGSFFTSGLLIKKIIQAAWGIMPINGEET
jgi:hypothetical protein